MTHHYQIIELNDRVILAAGFDYWCVYAESADRAAEIFRKVVSQEPTLVYKVRKLYYFALKGDKNE